MKSDTDRCAEYEKFKKIDEAFRSGDLDALRAAVDDSDVVPNGPMPLTIGSCLEYAIYHSPVPFIRTLLEVGANPNPDNHSRLSSTDCGFVVHPFSPWLTRQTGCNRDHEAAATLWRGL
jgi:hypothetical protein